MAQVKVDSELMTNYVSAVPVPPGSHFVNCLDPVSRRSMVFALSSDAVPKLQVIKEDENGNRMVIDLSKLLNLSVGTPVQAFDVQQAPDLTIFLSFATPLTPTESSISVVKPFQMTTEPALSLYPSVIVNTVQAMLLGTPSNNSSDFPMILACHQPIDRIDKGSDISRVFVNPLTSRCEVLRDLALPVNASGILGIAPATSIYGKGIFVLYTIQSTVQLLCEFVRPDPDGRPGDVYWFTSSVMCPASSSTITTFLDAKGYSALIIGHAQGLQYLNSNEAISKNKPGKILTSDPLLCNTKSLTLSQDSTHLSFWAINQDDQLIYSRTTTNLIEVNPVILQDKGEASAFSAAISKPADANGNTHPWQSVITVDEIGNLSQLQQCSDTGIWHSETFYVASDTTNVAVQSYTISIQGLDNRATSLGGGSVTVTSSSAVNVVLNGRTQTLSPAGTKLPLDSTGELAFIVSSGGIATQTLTLTALADLNGNIFAIDPIVIDPSRKVIEAFVDITTGEELGNAKTKNGKPLFEGVDKPSIEDLDQAAYCFQQLTDASNNLPANGSKQQLVRDIRKLADTDSLGDKFMDAFHWVKEKVHDAYNWTVKKIGDAWQFVCTIAGEVKSFVLDCIEKVGEAFSWVWSKIKLGFQKLIEFAGFLFNWDDILHTKNVIADFINAGMDYAVDQLKDPEKVQKAVDKFFDKLNDLVGKQLTLPIDSVATKSTEDAHDNETMHSTSYKWSGERAKNGGMGTSTTIHSSDPTSQPAQNLWKDTIQPALDKIQDDVSAISSDIQALFRKNSAMSTHDIFKQLATDVLAALFDTMRLVVKAILASIGNLISVIKDIANKKINIPIFSALYSLIAKNDLTVLDGISLIIAIPATIMIKLVTGKPTPDFGVIDKHTFGIIYNANEGGSSLVNEAARKPNETQKLLANGNTKQQPHKKSLAPASTDSTLEKFTPFGPVVVSTLILIKSIISDIRLIHAWKSPDKTINGTLPTAPSLRIIELLLTGSGAIYSLSTLQHPPGEDARGAAKSATVARCLIQAYTMKIGSVNDEYMMEPSILIDMVFEIINFSLNCKVYEDEINDPSWPGYNKDSSNLGLSSNIFNFVAMASKFVAMLTVKRAPEVGAGAIITQNISATVYSILSLARTSLDYHNGRTGSVIDPSI